MISFKYRIQPALLIPGLHPDTGCTDSYRNVLSDETIVSSVWLSWRLEQHVFVCQSFRVCSSKLQLNLCKKLLSL